MASDLTAWLTLPHMLMTSTPLRWQSSTTLAGTPSPATKALAPSAQMASTNGVRSHRVAHLAAHVDDEHPVAVAEFDHLGRHPEPGDKGLGALRTDGLDEWRPISPRGSPCRTC